MPDNERSELSSITMLQLAKEGKHPFQNQHRYITPQERGARTIKSNNIRKEQGILGFQLGHASTAGKIGGKIGGAISGKLNKGTIGVIFQNGVSKRISISEYNDYKNKMLIDKIPMSEWEFVTVRSKESKNRS